MKKGQWKSKEAEDLIILKGLLKNGVLSTPEIESGKRRIIDDIDIVTIPHSTLRIRLEELEKKDLIVPVKSELKSKRGLPIKRWDATVSGVLRWISEEPELFDNESKTFINAVMTYFPLITVSWGHLETIFGKTHLLRVMKIVCKNTHIESERKEYPEKFKKNTIMFLPARLAKRKFRWARMSRVSINITIDNKQLTLTRNYQDYSVSGPNPTTTFTSRVGISELISFAFYTQLMMDNFVDEKFESNKSSTFYFSKVINTIRVHPILLKRYLVYLTELYDDLEYQKKTIDRVLYSLKVKA